jgi:hypothetical protein
VKRVIATPVVHHHEPTVRQQVHHEDHEKKHVVHHEPEVKKHVHHEHHEKKHVVHHHEPEVKKHVHHEHHEKKHVVHHEPTVKRVIAAPKVVKNHAPHHEVPRHVPTPIAAPKVVKKQTQVTRKTSPPVVKKSPFVISPPPVARVTPVFRFRKMSGPTFIPKAIKQQVIHVAPQNSTVANCFYGSVSQVINTLENAALTYVKLCALEVKPRLSRLVDIAGIIGFTEGFSKTNPEKLPAYVINSINSLSSYPEFKFAGYLKELQYSFEEDISRNKIVDRLWLAIADELDSIVRQNNYPFFLRRNVWHLMQNLRIVNMLRANYPVKQNVCVSTTWKHVIHIYEIGSNPNFVTIFRKPRKTHCQKDAHTVQIIPEDFINGGTVITFWGRSNLENVLPPKSPQNVFTGYLNNRLVYEWTLSDSCTSTSAQVVHEFKVNNEVITIPSGSTCSDYFFVTLAIQKDCDKYRITWSVRFLASNTRRFGSRIVFADAIENVVFNFNQVITFNQNRYRNFLYTEDKEILLLSYATTAAVVRDIQPRATCDNQNHRCLYADLERCILCVNPPFAKYNGKCVTSCPDGFYNNGKGLCAPCAPQCGTCNGPKNGNCKTCVLGLFNFNSSCVPKCPDNMFPNKSGKCKRCGNNCTNCRDSKTCSKCAAEHFLKDGQCPAKCGSGWYASYQPNVCNKCQVGCVSCTNGKTCDVCDKGFFNRNGQCVRACGDHFWTNISTQRCEPCATGCLVCNNSKTCIKCDTGLALSKKTQTCVNKCNSGSVMIAGTCAPCGDKNCVRCSHTNTNDCKKCQNNFFLKQGKCVPVCGEGFYADAKRRCQPCTSNCKVCTKDRCLQCFGNRVVFKDTICLDKCVDGYVRSGNVCVKCNDPTNCRRCKANELETCTKCYKNQVFFSGRCLNKCPPKHFKKGNTCVPCQKGCESCENGYRCKKCEKDWFLKDHVCVDCCGVDTLMSSKLVKDVLSTIAMFVTQEALEDARNVSKTDSYTTTSATESAPLEPSLTRMDHASPVPMTALSAEIKTPALDVLTEKFYKETLANLSVTTATLLLTESAQLART